MGKAKKSEDQARSNLDAVAELRSYAERIVRIEDERKALAGDIKDVKNEAASRGFDKKALAIVVARMRESEEERAARDETAALADIYRLPVNDPAAVLRIVIEHARPHPEYEPPPLWADPSLARTFAPEVWPPQREVGA